MAKIRTLSLHIFLILIFSTFSIKCFSDDCKTPVECYMRAKDQLQEARKELRDATEEIKKMKAELESKIAACEIKTDNLMQKSQEATDKSQNAFTVSNQALETSKSAMNVASDSQSRSVSAFNHSCRMIFSCQHGCDNVNACPSDFPVDHNGACWNECGMRLCCNH